MYVNLRFHSIWRCARILFYFLLEHWNDDDDDDSTQQSNSIF